MRDKNLKKKAVMDANEILIKANKVKQQSIEEERLADRMNHFPFTHGDLIEKQRTVLSQLHGQDL
jgi:hypothetical protein